MFGLQKLVYNESVPFEMLSIQASSGGFEITFTQPLPENLTLADLKLSISQWYYQPTAAYGGPKLDQHSLRIREFNMNEERTSLSVSVDDRKEGYVIYFSFDPSFKSNSGENLWSGEAWYTLNAIPSDLL